MEEIFYKQIDEFIKSNKKEIIQNINLKDCNYLIENESEYADFLINQFKTYPITMDFNERDYNKDKSLGYYQDGTPVDVTNYTFNVPF